MAHWHSTPALFSLSSYVDSHHIALVPQSSAYDQFNCTFYYVTLNSNCEAQRIPKFFKEIVENKS